MKRALWLLLRIGISAGLLWFLLHRVSYDELAEFVANTLENWPWLLAGIAMPMWGITISSWRLQCLLRSQRLDAGVGELSLLHVVSSFYNQVLPSTIGADLYRTYWISRIRSVDGESAAPADRLVVATTVIGVDRLIGAVGIVATAFAAAAIEPSVVRSSPALMTAFPLIGAGAIAVCALPFLATRSLGRWLFGIPVLRKVRDKAVTLFGALRAYRKAPRLMLAAFLLSMLLQLSITVQWWFFSQALGLGLSLWSLLVLIPVVTLITMIPVTINGIGLRETALRTLGASLGFTAASAVALGGAFLLNKTLWALVGGVVQVFHKPR